MPRGSSGSRGGSSRPSGSGLFSKPAPKAAPRAPPPAPV